MRAAAAACVRTAALQLDQLHVECVHAWHCHSGEFFVYTILRHPDERLTVFVRPQKQSALTILPSSSVIPKKSPLRSHSISPIAVHTTSSSSVVSSSSLSSSSQQQQLSLAPPAALPVSTVNAQATSLKFTPLALSQHLSNGAGAAPKGVTVQPIAINFTTSADGVLTATSSTASHLSNGSGGVVNNGGGLQIISTNGNGVLHHHHLSQPQPQPQQQQHLQHNVITTTGQTGAGLNSTSITAKLLKSGHVREFAPSGGADPPKKMLKLINGTTVAGGSVTLSQVVVSPISASNLATIELSSGSGCGSNGVQRTTVTSSGIGSNGGGAQLQKLLVHGGVNNGNNGHIVNGGNGHTSTSELARLPGGAELNILTNGGNGGSAAAATATVSPPSTTTTTTATASLFRQHNGKLAIVNSGFTFKSKFFMS